MIAKKTKNKTYELVAPDGGWGYMIIVGVTFNMISVASFVHCFGVIYKELFIQLKMDTTNITFFNGITCFGVAVSGFITSFLLNYLSFRKLGVIGATIFNIGMLGTVFTKSKLHFFLFQGLLQSIGHGIIINLSFTAINIYFVKKRLFANSIAQTVTAAFGLVTPRLVKWAIEVYGFRGCVLLITGVSMHSIFAMILLQPVAWHMKKVEILEDNENESKTLLIKNTNSAIKKEDLTASMNSNKTNKSEHAAIEAGEKPPEETTGRSILKQVKFVSLAYTGLYFFIGANRFATLVHANFFIVIVDGSSIWVTWWKIVCQIVDVSLIRTFILSNACIGAALCLFSEMTFVLMVPQALYFMGWDENEVAWALSLNALGDLVTRTLLIFMSSILAKFGSHKIYIVGLAIAFGTRLGMLWSDNRIAITTFLAIMGISRCTVMVLTSVVVADTVPLEKFSSAMGVLFLIFGIFNLTIGPVVGAVRDLTDSYATAFYILTSFFAIVMIFWSIELFYKMTKHKRLKKNSITSKP